MKFFASWMTDGYYAFSKRAFRLEIPFLHSQSAHSLSVRYCPTFNKLIIEGKISKPAKAIYDPYPIRDEEEIKYKLQ